MIKEDEYLERVVAGIHAISSNDADVRWNETINGRQFDVVVRFKLGTLNYLVLVEVKNRTRRASACDVEAFVTKARDHQANKAVFVTVAGFQEGAVTVAKRHGVDLFKITFDKDDFALSVTTTYWTHENPDYAGNSTPHLAISDPVLTDVIEKTRLRYIDGSWFDVPSEASQMNYYAAKTLLGDGRVLGELMQSAPQRFLDEGQSRTETIEVKPFVTIMPPDEYHFPRGTLTEIEVTLVTRMSRILSGNIGIEPTAFSCPVIYTNVLTGDETRYTLDQLPLNTAPLLVGHFYLQLHPLRYFHCAEVRNGKVTWRLIESFQREQLIRSTYIQDKKYGSFYVPVSDKATINRLKGRLADFLNLTPSPPAEPHGRARHPRRRPKALRGR